ncbi:MAG: hypothetical protein HFJ38_04365 [Bacilli bacterium]|nr:hypothetical protein [Bacilli bacterium]
MDGLIRILYNFKFSVFGVTLDSANLVGSIQQLTDFSDVQNINIWSIGKTVNDVIVPIALSLLILFFMINLIKKSMEVERISWERVVMAFISFLLLKYFIQNGYTFLTTIMNIVNDIFVSVTNVLSNSNTNINIAETLINAIPSGFVDKIMTYGLYLILFIPFMTTIVQILTQIFLRIVKLILCFAFAPIPIALAADDEGRGKAVQFFLFAASVGLEAVIIYLATNIYAIGLSGLSGTVSSTNAISTIVAMLFLNGMYLAVIQYGSQFAEKLVGGH